MGKIAFVCAGQGAQTIGMGKELYDHLPVCRSVFDKADAILNRSISGLCFEGPKDQLDQTKNTQPCVFTVDMAAVEALKERGVTPSMAAGFSLGEYAALTVSGVLDIRLAFEVVGKRAAFMQEAVPPGIGGMAAVLKLETPVIEEICDRLSTEGIVEPVNYNCPGQTVIAGDKETVAKAGVLLAEAGGRVIPLPVSGPFHTRMMKPAAEQLRLAIEKIQVNDPSIPFYSNVTADKITESGRIREAMVRQVMSKVRWHESVLSMIRDGAQAFVEAGPGKTLSGFIKRITTEIPVFNVEDMASLESTVQGLKQAGLV